MAEVQIKQDFDSYSRNLQHTLETLLRISQILEVDIRELS